MVARKNSSVGKNGILISLMGHDNYCTKNSTKRVVKYILRSDKSSKAGKNDVLYHGTYGAIDFLGENFIVKQFDEISTLNTYNGKVKRYIDHQIFSFSEESEKIIEANPNIWKDLCSDMTLILSDEQYQTVYALHAPDEDCDHLHIHFGINTVNFCTGKKRQENWQRNKKHLEQLDTYLENILEQY